MVMGTPGRVPPVLHETATERPPLEYWDPNGDILIPAMQAEIAYAPPIVIAPPQLPTPDQHPNRREFPMRALKAFFDTAAVDRVGSQLGFTAHSVSVDNMSNQWLWFPSARRWVPPGAYGFIFPIADGASVAEWHVQIPVGHAAGTVGTPASNVVTVWFEDYLTPNNGIILTI